MRLFTKIALPMFLLGALASGSFAQDSAKDDIKDAGHDTKEAAKDTGRAVKKTTKKTVHATKKGVHKTAKKVANKTEDK